MKQWTILVLIAAMATCVWAQDEGAEKAKPEKKKGGAFAAMDANKDGQVDKDEFIASSKKRAEKSGKEFNAEKSEALFAKKDKNADGVLTKDEMAPAEKGKKAEEGETESSEEE